MSRTLENLFLSVNLWKRRKLVREIPLQLQGKSTIINTLSIGKKGREI